MNNERRTGASAALDSYDEPVDRVEFGFDLAALGLGDATRRQFMQALGAGLLIAVALELPAEAQQRGGRGGRGGGGRPSNVSARIHVGKDGAVTLLTGKVEGGQGARAQLAQAAAEELRLPASRVTVLMADTALVPNDGITAGSRTTPSTMPAVRQGAAAAREVLAELACKRWGVPRAEVEVRDGRVVHAARERELTYAELAAGDEESARAFAQATIPTNVTVTPVGQWKVLGTSHPRPNRRDLVTGAHRYPSDIVRPGMLYAKVLRAPSYGARLQEIDLAPARAMKDVVAVRDGAFVGFAAPTTYAAEQAMLAASATARWEAAPHVDGSRLFDHLRRTARGGIPRNPFAEDVTRAARAMTQEYHVAYVQHAPMEPRAAVAEWDADGRLTVWTATQNPFGVRGELARAFGLGEDRVRVIVPDFGGGFGGKHTGECAVEAARIAKAAGRPVCLRWTREEEFTWAYFRPAALIEAEASLDAGGTLTSWHFVNVNSGGAALETPYRVGKSRCVFVQAEAPLRHGSYRALASVANNFAREVFMDELAEAAGKDPLEFRLAHLENARIRAVLEEAARRFNWSERVKRKDPNVGVGLACGTEKGSVVAACVEVEIDRARGQVRARKVCQAFECGKITSPDNLLAQVHGCIIMGLGPALREEMRFEGGKVLNASFGRYQPPRFEDVPELDIRLLDRPDLPSAGAGETPIIAVAPAIANAVFHATGTRVREMPIRVPQK